MPKIMAWVQKILLKHHVAISKYEIFRHVPWSIVYRIFTDDGVYFLKSSHVIYSDEWKILNHFQHYHYLHTPVMIAYHQKSNSILLKDAGHSAHTCLQGRYSHKMMLKVIDYYADIQVKSSHYLLNLNRLISMNLDLKTFASDFKNFLNQDTKLLMLDGLDEKSLYQLKKLIVKIHEICLWIDGFGIPQSIEHGDLFDENFLLKGRHLIISDWADSCLSHPFFSFGFFIERLQENYSISIPQYLSLKHCYLSHWRQYASTHDLNRILFWMNHLSKLRTVMSYSRIAKLTKNKDMDIYKGYLQKNLMAFIHQFSETSSSSSGSLSRYFQRA